MLSIYLHLLIEDDLTNESMSDWINLWIIVWHKLIGKWHKLCEFLLY